MAKEKKREKRQASFWSTKRGEMEVDNYNSDASGRSGGKGEGDDWERVGEFGRMGRVDVSKSGEKRGYDWERVGECLGRIGRVDRSGEWGERIGWKERQREKGSGALGKGRAGLSLVPGCK